MGLSNGQYVVTFMISNECITDNGLSVVTLARLSHRVACLGVMSMTIPCLRMPGIQPTTDNVVLPST